MTHKGIIAIIRLTLAFAYREWSYYFLHNDGHSIYYWNGRKEALEEVLNLLEKGKTA